MRGSLRAAYDARVLRRDLLATLVLAVAPVALSCNVTGSLGGLQGSGTKASVTRTPPSFNAVTLKNSANVTIAVGGPPSVTIETDDNLLANITTEVSGDTLTIGSDKSFSTHLGVKVSVSAPSLERIDMLGSGSVDAAGIKAQAFHFHLAGSGDAAIRGTADRLTVGLTGSGNVHLYDLVAKEAEVTLGGSGNVEVNASETVKARLTGSGNVDYKGNPAHVDRSVVGSGAIRAR